MQKRIMAHIFIILAIVGILFLLFSLSGTENAEGATTWAQIWKDVNSLSDEISAVKDLHDPTVALPAEVVGDRYIATDTGNGWTNNYIYEWDGAVWDETTIGAGENGDFCYVTDLTSFYSYTHATTSWGIVAETYIAKTEAGGITTYTYKNVGIVINQAAGVAAFFGGGYVNCQDIDSTENNVTILFDTSGKDLGPTVPNRRIDWIGTGNTIRAVDSGTNHWFLWLNTGSCEVVLSGVELIRMRPKATATAGVVSLSNCVLDSETDTGANANIWLSTQLQFWVLRNCTLQSTSNLLRSVVSDGRSTIMLFDCTITTTTTAEGYYASAGGVVVAHGTTLQSMLTLNGGWIEASSTITLSETGASGGILGAYSQIDDVASMSTGDGANYLLLKDSMDGVDTDYSTVGSPMQYYVIAPTGYVVSTIEILGAPIVHMNGSFTYHTTGDTQVNVTYSDVSAPSLEVYKFAECFAYIGGTINYIIWINNTGTANATEVYLNDTFDNVLIYISGNENSRIGNFVSWYWSNIENGTGVIAYLNVSVNTSATHGQIVFNYGYLNSTLQNLRTNRVGIVLLGTPSNVNVAGLHNFYTDEITVFASITYDGITIEIEAGMTANVSILSYGGTPIIENQNMVVHNASGGLFRYNNTITGIPAIIVVNFNFNGTLSTGIASPIYFGEYNTNLTNINNTVNYINATTQNIQSLLTDFWNDFNSTWTSWETLFLNYWGEFNSTEFFNSSEVNAWFNTTWDMISDFEGNMSVSLSAIDGNITTLQTYVNGFNASMQNHFSALYENHTIEQSLIMGMWGDFNVTMAFIDGNITILNATLNFVNATVIDINATVNIINTHILNMWGDFNTTWTDWHTTFFSYWDDFNTTTHGLNVSINVWFNTTWSLMADFEANITAMLISIDANITATNVSLASLITSVSDLYIYVVNFNWSVQQRFAELLAVAPIEMKTTITEMWRDWNRTSANILMDIRAIEPSPEPETINQNNVVIGTMLLFLFLCVAIILYGRREDWTLTRYFIVLGILFMVFYLVGFTGYVDLGVQVS